MKGRELKFDDNDPILVGKWVDVIVRVRVNFNQISKFFNSADERPDAWAIGGIRDSIPTEQAQGGVAIHSLCHEE